MIEEIRRVMQQFANSERAAFSKKYMKSEYSFYGLTVPVMRAIAKKYKNLEMNQALILFDQLWNSGNHEEMCLGIFILQNMKNTSMEMWDFLIRRLDRAKSWDHIDYLSTDLLGKIVLNHPELMQKLKEMAQSRNPWIRRTAINATYQMIKKNKLDMTFLLAEKLVYDEDVYVQKGAGWMLREAGKRNRLALRDFLMMHLDMKATAFSYATEKMKEMRKIRKNRNKEKSSKDL